MPPRKSADGSDGPVGLTDGELKFIKAIFDNMTQKPDANWASVATDLNLKDAKCAKERFRQMSIRHKWGENAGSAASSPRGKGKNGATGASGDGKIAKKPRTPRKKAKKEEDEPELGPTSPAVKSEDDKPKSEDYMDEV